jgi:cytochrome P450
MPKLAQRLISPPDLEERARPAGPEVPAAPSIISGSASDPAPLVAHLREHDPVCWLAGLDAWLVTRHDDVRLLFSEPRVTADPRAYHRYQAPEDPRVARWLLEMPFRSTGSNGTSSGRRLVATALTPRAVARMESCVRDAVEHFAAPLRGRTDVVDLVGEFTVPVSTTAIGRILGVPPKDEDDLRFRQLAVHATSTIRPFLSEKKQRSAERAAAEMGEYILALVTERCSAPSEDFISDLLKASGGATPAIAEDLTRVIAGLVSAGTGTTSVACGRALRTLLRHPEPISLLLQDRSLLPNAVEELLRHDSGLLVMPRYVLEDFVLRGRALRKGQLVILSLLGANRDPRVFRDPDAVDFRRDTREAMAFGHGTHYCIGANIARMEMRLMLDAALDFIPLGARLLEDEIRWSEKGLMSQIKSLPVDFASRAAGTS